MTRTWINEGRWLTDLGYLCVGLIPLCIIIILLRGDLGSASDLPWVRTAFFGLPALIILFAWLSFFSGYPGHGTLFIFSFITALEWFILITSPILHHFFEAAWIHALLIAYFPACGLLAIWWFARGRWVARQIVENRLS